MKIVSWNVAGLRAQLKKPFVEELINIHDPDIICFQETKCEENQVIIPEDFQIIYPYRFWSSTKGTTQRKGLSGTSIWSKIQPNAIIQAPEADEEGRVTTLEFENFIIMNIYTPNSQGLDSHRLKYRTEHWHNSFKNYINILKNLKPTIICGDFNVANEEIDIHAPEKNKTSPGFLDIERIQFKEYLNLGYIDEIRKFYPDKKELYTYWSILNPKIRENNKGWRIDYFITSKLINSKKCEILDKIMGSDHCPVLLEL